MNTPPLPPELPPIPDSVRFAGALGQFSRSMDHFAKLHEQTSTRLSKVIRLGMIALATLFIAVFLMLLTIIQRVNLMVDNVSAINGHFNLMVPDISHMHASMIRMQENILSIEDIPNEMNKMIMSMDDMHHHMSHMHTQLASMNNSTEQIVSSTENIGNQMLSMEQPMTAMQVDLQKMSRPMNLFNRMMPGR